ncbi:hypothetical protein AB0K52_10990 [Glycomyces sp. NPDC049804]|uniref:hypothetical protein n=1 Tax=Glycomyces sp. NPDC049804 TaxID=3154363 RepID=UPI00343066EF
MTANRQGVERGSFSDDYRTYRVRASGADAPDSFQVLTGDHDDIVLIVSGLNSGDLKATWGPFWRSFKPTWKIWVEEAAFRVFECGRQEINSAPASIRFCRG